MPPQLNYVPIDLLEIGITNANALQPFITLFPEGGGPSLAAGLAFSPDGRALALLGENGRLQIWDLDTLETQYLYTGEPVTYPRVTYSPIGNAFAATGQAVGDDGAFVAVLHFWETPPAGEPEEIFASQRGVTSVTFSPDGFALAAGIQIGMGGGGGIKIWDTATGELRFTIDTPDWVSDVAFSPDGKVLAGSSFDSVTLWSPYTSQEINSFSVGRGPIERMVFSLQEDNLGLIAQGVLVVDAVTGEILHTIDVNGRDLVFSPNNELLIVAGEDGLSMWDRTSGQMVASFPGGNLLAVAISPLGNALATVSDDGKVEIWGVFAP
jgi:WD40 repeat protein